MAESMVERVARAMFYATNEHDTTWESEAQEIKTTYLIMARAAIEAMREPTDAMVQAGVDANHTLEAIEGYPEYPESCANIYRAMIDAALNEQVSG